jgi:hypothetical protein
MGDQVTELQARYVFSLCSKFECWALITALNFGRFAKVRAVVARFLKGFL